MRIERAAAYRAAVDAAYRQDAIDRGYARAEKTGRETITPAMRRIVAEAPERYPAGPENRSDGRDRLAVAAEPESSRAVAQLASSACAITSPGPPRSSSATPAASDTRP